MDSPKQIGIRQFRARLAVAIRDTVLSVIARPEQLPGLTGIPIQEQGAIADLRDDQRAALANVVAWALDVGIHNFLYGLDNQPDGLEVRYQGLPLKDDIYSLSDDRDPLWQDSQFTKDGLPKSNG